MSYYITVMLGLKGVGILFSQPETTSSGRRRNQEVKQRNVKSVLQGHHCKTNEIFLMFIFLHNSNDLVQDRMKQRLEYILLHTNWLKSFIFIYLSTSNFISSCHVQKNGRKKQLNKFSAKRLQECEKLTMNKSCSRRISSIVITFPEGVKNSYTSTQQKTINNQTRKCTK